MEKVSVAVRVRPAKSEDSGNGTFWKVEDNRISLHKSHGTPISGVSFAFDHVFDQDCSNSRVYELVIENIIHAALEGFNGTAFAYGQTSSGKTYTMNGSENDAGIIQRAVNNIFTKIHMAVDREYLIRVSYLEIYNEEINDLFVGENQKLSIHESLERGVFVAGLREEIVNSAEQVFDLLKLGEAKRHFGETNMNVRSSRSHTIFRMVIESKEKNSSDDAIRVSVLNLVDLAGSERIAKTGAGGVRLKEGKHINKSLMVLGNVINKLSEGAKQRGHIPYRDSKLTRILQPALGGNAKTSIICTVAREEVHIEETRGTLQFASRAKRITNCVQVNEILTDAALLKRQKLEIEELRQKLEGSHSEVLEQQILKLRNDLLTYELEREKLAMALEEERRTQKERIMDQQRKLDELCNQSALSDTNGHTAQNTSLHNFGERKGTCQDDAFSTPCYKAAPSAFVAKRSNNSRRCEYSPLPDAFGDFADEDTWAKINKGFIADLDDRSTPDCNQEVENLRRELKQVLKERDEFKADYLTQRSLNEDLMKEISQLRQEASLVQEIPERHFECIVVCKDIYKDVLSIVQNCVANEKSPTAKLLSASSEIGISLFSTLESNFKMDMDGDISSSRINVSFEDQRTKLCEKANSTISSITSQHPEKVSNSSKHKGSTLEQDIDSWKRALEDEVAKMKAKCCSLEKELEASNQLVVASSERHNSLDKQVCALKEERDMLVQRVRDSTQKVAHLTDQRDTVLKNLCAEEHRRKELEEDIRGFSLAFARRQKTLLSLQCDFRSSIDNFKVRNPVQGSSA
ncbi:unnamed protein product [Cuscuta campestris]|uniref:Kinesin-like protein n=1 Tax=Cuscuta campestris TaxID=132261 RepID=A0A484NFK2_9ASTE|nr:unnamed protein product [Cuscuta campestris]